jgi:hypothetical protein
MGKDRVGEMEGERDYGGNRGTAKELKGEIII